MAFFKSFQQNLPSVSSLVDTISSAVEDLSTAVGEVSYALSDSVAGQVASMMHGFYPEEESCTAEEAAGSSKVRSAVLWDTSKTSAGQKTQSDREQEAKQSTSYDISAPQNQVQEMHEQGFYVRDGQWKPSEHKATGGAGGSALQGLGNDGISAAKQKMVATPSCRELERPDKPETAGGGSSRNGQHGVQEVGYLEVRGNPNSRGHKAMGDSKARPQHAAVSTEHEQSGSFVENRHLMDSERSDHLKKAKKHGKHDGFGGNEYSGNKCSPEDNMRNSRYRTQKSIVKEYTHSAPSTNCKIKFPGKIKEKINPTKYYKVKGDIKTKKNEANSAKRGAAENKVGKYSKILPEKGEVS